MLTAEKIAELRAALEGRTQRVTLRPDELREFLDDIEALRAALETADWARSRLERYADAANAGEEQAGGRELKRKVWAAFADFDARRALSGKEPGE